MEYHWHDAHLSIPLSHITGLEKGISCQFIFSIQIDIENVCGFRIRNYVTEMLTPLAFEELILVLGLNPLLAKA